MPEWVTWVFDGIGSTIFSIAVSALITSLDKGTQPFVVCDG